MNDTAVLIVCIVLRGASGLLGWVLGHREGDLEGFLNGAMAVLTANDDFLSYNSHMVRSAVEKAEQENSGDDDDWPENYP